MEPRNFTFPAPSYTPFIPVPVMLPWQPEGKRWKKRMGLPSVWRFLDTMSHLHWIPLTGRRLWTFTSTYCVIKGEMEIRHSRNGAYDKRSARVNNVLLIPFITHPNSRFPVQHGGTTVCRQTASLSAHSTASQSEETGRVLGKDKNWGGGEAGERGNQAAKDGNSLAGLFNARPVLSLGPLPQIAVLWPTVEMSCNLFFLTLREPLPPPSPHSKHALTLLQLPLSHPSSPWSTAVFRTNYGTTGPPSASEDVFQIKTSAGSLLSE